VKVEKLAANGSRNLEHAVGIGPGFTSLCRGELPIGKVRGIRTPGFAAA